MEKIVPKLGLDDITDPQLEIYTDDKKTKINLSAPFAAVDPDTVTVDNKRVQFHNALIAADNGDVSQTALKNQYRAELETLLTRQAYDCAKIANGDMALYLTTGYDAKNLHGTPIGELGQVTGLVVDYGTNDGELRAGWDPMSQASNFSVQVYSDINNPTASILKEYIVAKLGKEKTVLDALPTGQIVYTRVRANGGSTGHGAWSQPAKKRVP